MTFSGSRGQKTSPYEMEVILAKYEEQDKFHDCSNARSHSSLNGEFHELGQNSVSLRESSFGVRSEKLPAHFSDK